jgi:hypothetical protein
MKVTDAMIDLREGFLGMIFKGCPEHKKVWKAEEIQNAFSSAMYDVAVYYFERIDRRNGEII